MKHWADSSSYKRQGELKHYCGGFVMSLHYFIGPTVLGVEGHGKALPVSTQPRYFRTLLSCKSVRGPKQSSYLVQFLHYYKLIPNRNSYIIKINHKCLAYLKLTIILYFIHISFISFRKRTHKLQLTSAYSGLLNNQGVGIRTRG